MNNAILFLYNISSIVSGILAVLGIVSIVCTFIAPKPIESLPIRTVIMAFGCLAIMFAALIFIIQDNFRIMPTVRMQSLSTAIQSLEERGLIAELAPGVETEGENSVQIVVWASRSKGELVYKGESILLYTNTSSIGQVTVPDVVGKTKDEAIECLTESGLAVHISYGDAEAYSDHGPNWDGWVIDYQYAPAGSEVYYGAEIFLSAVAEEDD